MKNQEGERFSESSPILPTKYAYDAATLIRSLTSNFKIIVIVMSILSFFAVAHLLHEMGARIIYLDEIFETGMAVISISLLILTVYLFSSLIKSRSILTRWADLFERNSIRVGMTIALDKRSKEEAIKSIAETVQELGEPLRNYISSHPELDKFINVHRGKALVFDILIDKDVPGITNELKSILEDYGAVVGKVTDGDVNENVVTTFVNNLSDYTRESKNAIGLAVIIGENVSDTAYSQVIRSMHQIEKQIVLVEKR